MMKKRRLVHYVIILIRFYFNFLYIYLSISIIRLCSSKETHIGNIDTQPSLPPYANVKPPPVDPNVDLQPPLVEGTANDPNTDVQSPNIQHNSTSSVVQNITNAPQKLNSFVDDNDPVKISALVQILILARDSQQESWRHTIGFGHRKSWLEENVPIWFQHDGILSVFKKCTARVMMEKIAKAESKARTQYDAQGTHSSDPTGSRGESFPRWVELFVEYLEWNNSQSKFI